MESSSHHVILLAGPNGAGKSTAADALLRGVLAVDEFVNADVIARGLSAFQPQRVAMAAGKVMLRRLDELAERRANFAFETTLASRSFAPWLKSLQPLGYQFHLIFLWLPSPEMAIERVATRVRQGGHDVPADVIRRRYHAGLRNFFHLYRPMSTTWRFCDNSKRTEPVIIARGEQDNESVPDPALWAIITGAYAQ